MHLEYLRALKLKHPGRMLDVACRWRQPSPWASSHLRLGRFLVIVVAHSKRRISFRQREPDNGTIVVHCGDFDSLVVDTAQN
jgi:hypothetical protein